MTTYLSIEDICDENKVLKERIISLEKELAASIQHSKCLKEIIDNQNEENAVEILEYFHSCSSIRRTAWKYGMDMEELYELIPRWDGCRDGLQSADDYHECRIDVIGRKEYDDEQEEDMDAEELALRQRTPEPDEITKIMGDYTGSDLSLYELADRYNLRIENLFRLLKENKLIEKETDARGYANFYVDHNGVGAEWDGKSGMGLIYELR